MALAEMDALAVQQSSQQRFGSWNSASSDVHNTINKLSLNLNHQIANITKGTGCGYDMVSMEMEDTPTGGGVTGAGDVYTLPLHHGHSTRTLNLNHGVMSTPIHMLSVPHYMHHHAMGKPMAARKYPCKMCSQVFESKTEYQMHIQSHMREPKPYKCLQCPKSFANSSYLSQHMRIHLGIKPYHCDVCKKKFTQLSHLQQHLRTHTGDKPYKCHHQGCHKAFSQLSNLQSHSRCHQTDKPHKCNSCYKCFYDELSLQEHIPKHKDSKHLKTHICSFCGKSYTQETYLARHMAKHSDKMHSMLSMGINPADKRAAAAVHALAQAANGKSSDDYYWPKQETTGDLHGTSRLHMSDDLYSPYNAYPYPHSNPNFYQYPSSTPHDMMVSASSSNKNMAASVFSLSNGARGGFYYPDSMTGLHMKNHNGMAMGDSDGPKSGSTMIMEDAFPFGGPQTMRSFPSFNASGMPTMLPGSGEGNGGSGGQRKEGHKGQRY